MKIIFVNLKRELCSEHPIHLYAPLDIGYCISQLERTGHRVHFIDANTENYTSSQLISLIKKSVCQILVIKPEVNTIDVTLEIAKNVAKEIKYKIAIGPIATTEYRNLIFKNTPIDFVILNEPELVLLDLINKLEKSESIKEVKGLAHFKNKLIINQSEFIDDLNKIPFPKHDFFVNKGYTFCYPVDIRRKINIGYMLASRGCSQSCLFCSPIERVSYGKIHRVRDVNNVVDEIEFLSKKGINVIYFRDDNFTANKSYILRICDEIIKRKLKTKWVAQSRIDSLDKKLLLKMKKAGCSTLCLGIESGNDRILKILNKKINTKQIIEAVKLIKETGIWIVGFFIIGNPTETYKEMEETFSLAKQLNPEMVQVHFFTAYPGSSIFNNKKYKDLPKISKFKILNENSLHNKLEKFQKSFYRRYYFRPKYLLSYTIKQIPTMITNWNLQKNLIKKTIRFLIKT